MASTGISNISEENKEDENEAEREESDKENLPKGADETKDEEFAVEGDDKKEEREFPDAFYDPGTGKIMTDPVVNPAGDSYEKSTITDTSVIFYPNRALKSIIQRETELASGSIRGTLRRIDESIRSDWSRLVEKSAFGTEHRPLPDSFYCPITCDLIQDPVITKDGNSYEREAIENWVQVNGVSPITRNPLTVSEIRNNNALYELIQKEKGRTEESIHPSIRRWKESGVPTSRRPVSESQGEEPSAPAAAATQASPVPTTAASANYPTTEAEIAARRRRRSQASFTFGVLCITVLVCMLFLPFAAVVGILFAISAIALLCSGTSR